MGELLQRYNFYALLIRAVDRREIYPALLKTNDRETRPANEKRDTLVEKKAHLRNLDSKGFSKLRDIFATLTWVDIFNALCSLF